jgi:hypothetical protein
MRYVDEGRLVDIAEPDGRPVHTDTITECIRLRDVWHAYPTVSLDSLVDPKIVADRIGRAAWRTPAPSTLISRPRRTGAQPRPSWVLLGYRWAPCVTRSITETRGRRFVSFPLWGKMLPADHPGDIS